VTLSAPTAAENSSGAIDGSIVGVVGAQCGRCRSAAAGAPTFHLPHASITLSGCGRGPAEGDAHHHRGAKRLPSAGAGSGGGGGWAALTRVTAAAAAAAAAAATTAAAASSSSAAAARPPPMTPSFATDEDDPDGGAGEAGRGPLRLWQRFRRRRQLRRQQQQQEAAATAGAAAFLPPRALSTAPRPPASPGSLEALVQPLRPALLQLGEALGPGRLLVAGALSAVVSRTAVAPLERVKMELQLRSAALAGRDALGSGAGALRTALGVLREEGARGFWRGHGVNVLRTAPHKAVNFACFDIYSQAALGAVAALFVASPPSRGSGQVAGADGAGRINSTDTNNKDNASGAAVATTLARFGAGALAGVTATLTCYPLDVLRTRLCAPGAAGAVDAYRAAYGAGPLGVLFGIARHEGAGALYVGCLPAVVGMVPAGAIFYGVFAALKDAHLAREQEAFEAEAQEQEQPGRSTGRRPPRRAPSGELPVGATLLFGAAAGAASELVVYPLEVVRRRMQLQQAAAAGAAGAVAATGGAGAAAAAAAGPALRAVAAGAAGAGGATAVSRVVTACVEIARQRGLRGLYSGLGPNLLQVLPSSALSYYTFETAKTALGGGGGGGCEAAARVGASTTQAARAAAMAAPPLAKKKNRGRARDEDVG